MTAELKGTRLGVSLGSSLIGTDMGITGSQGKWPTLALVRFFSQSWVRC